MRTVREKIQLEDLGIEELKPRKAITGALILEIHGPNGRDKAIALKEKMEEALIDMEGTKVTRPEKVAEIRVKDIVDSIDAQEIREVMAKIGECNIEEIKVGEIRKPPTEKGLGTLWIQCPVRAANKIAATGKVKIGWTTSRVELLAPRQIRCYRCLEKGHVESKCTSNIDRSGLCYRCGGIGHQARQCNLPPKCLVCQEAGLPDTHRVGSLACKAPAKNKNKGKLENSQPAVRGGPVESKKPAPVPVRLRKGKEEENKRPEKEQKTIEENKMKVEVVPLLSQEQPLEQRKPRVVKGITKPE